MCTQSSMVSDSHLRVCEGGRVGGFKFVCVRACACVYVSVYSLLLVHIRNNMCVGYCVCVIAMFRLA